MDADAARRSLVKGVSGMPERLGAKHWLECAREAQEIAEHMTDDEAREAILRIVHGYRVLAERAKARENGVDVD
jgi:hypothetical protein